MTAQDDVAAAGVAANDAALNATPSDVQGDRDAYTPVFDAGHATPPSRARAEAKAEALKLLEEPKPPGGPALLLRFDGGGDAPTVVPRDHFATAHRDGGGPPRLGPGGGGAVRESKSSEAANSGPRGPSEGRS